MTYSEFVKKWIGKGIDLLSAIGNSRWYMTLFKKCSTCIELCVSFLKRGVFFMKNCVFSPSSNNQILNSIIRMISVNVVNNFPRLKFSTDKFFNKKSITSTFPMGVSFSFHKVQLTLARTKNEFSFFVAFIISKFNSAVITIKKALSGLVVTLAITKSRFLGWWCLKDNSTHFTSIFHITNYNIQCL